MVIGTYIVNGRTALQAKALCRSLRIFGGAYSKIDFYVAVPEYLHDFPSLVHDLEKDGINVLPFDFDNNFRIFPFSARAAAAAHFENQFAGNKQHLVWMDADSVFCQQPDILAQSDSVKVACRPVDHRLVGLPWGEPLNLFWKLVFSACKLENQVFTPVTTSTSPEEIYPYFNAGMLVVRSGDFLLSKWYHDFREAVEIKDFQLAYKQDIRHKIFLHQAILAGVLLRETRDCERIELPFTVNYALHLHSEYSEDKRVETLNELVSFRYDTLQGKPYWWRGFRAEDPLLSWMEAEFPLLII